MMAQAVSVLGRKVITALAVAGVLAVATGVAIVPATSHAAPAKGKAKKAVSLKEPAPIAAAPPLTPATVRFGLSVPETIRVFEKVIDDDHAKEYDDAEPGVQMERLKAEIEQKKLAFRSSLIEFNEPPSRYDATPFEGEFTYGNREAVLSIERKGRVQHMFFIRGRLWKLIDVYKLGKKTKWGEDFNKAVEVIEEKIGTPGRRLAPDAAAGRPFEEVDWADPNTRVRLVNWGSRLAIAYSERRTEQQLDALRTNKVAGKRPEEIDPSVKDALR
jgi:hypothetical protein